jgi:fumarate reductase subunit C
VETFLPIIRNAVIILASLAALAAAGVAIGTWFARHTHEPH